MPILIVYNAAGVMVYSGFDPKKNSAFLRGLPQSIVGQGKAEGLLQRSEIFDAVPYFSTAKNAIESDHHVLVLSITQYPFSPWNALQDNAVKELAQKGSALKIDVLQAALDMKN
ncbi:hypothetical protein [Acidicapsa ligni]|uniref:hypothetical protein n=1 Tax=Acidicapsa ligni TaxID=542300 RepID=UPI0021E05D0F|nr:hypothetical protein [Acidicapsa ligni]